MPASTVERVPRHTPGPINEQIRRQTEQNVARSAAGPAAIGRRLAELDRERDIERALEANAVGVSLLGLALGAAVDRRFFILPGLVAAFLLRHAVQGWCPPVTVFRRRDFRTASEIGRERYAPKALRGDFRNVPAVPEADPGAGVRQALRAVQT